jgi:hypothetical protein
MAPVKTFVGTPPAEYQPTDANLFAAQFNGINSMVCKLNPLHSYTSPQTEILTSKQTPTLGL